ncbi:uncharacterized protein LOC112693365 isoform X2 [Sipha flava]|uniref:Uncharacterized protein LOC112680010 isoform X2 n=1 Tax=Sipha flava TaxID=143950 RepID=A0A8B8FU61_9HEMI|nr:uncharacterized protein LOC112680010 isoform X2 [Sipha flava]XP_025414337.1 uncharacterized protein LOC112686332 isoform X2 [Sipha flava]XP_025424177.1 uncharacterized protein LOC112693365 isoform X2 [Sipha flava]
MYKYIYISFYTSWIFITSIIVKLIFVYIRGTGIRVCNACSGISDQFRFVFCVALLKLTKMNKQRFQSGHAKRKAKQKEALIACGNDKSQKKICFFPTIRQGNSSVTSDPVLNITENNSSDFENDLIHANDNSSTGCDIVLSTTESNIANTERNITNNTGKW